MNFVNFSNHASKNWCEEQINAAKQWGTIVDIPFPAVDPRCSSKDLDLLAEECMKQILAYAPAAVMCQGEFSLVYKLVNRLHEYKIPVYAACSERNVIEVKNEDGTTTKQAVFAFVQFREYR